MKPETRSFKNLEWLLEAVTSVLTPKAQISEDKSIQESAKERGGGRERERETDRQTEDVFFYTKTTRPNNLREE